LDSEQQRAQNQANAAIRTGDLVVLDWRVTADNPLGDYRVKPDVAIQWATRVPGRFPRFPFSAEDLPARITADDVPSELQRFVAGVIEAWKVTPPGAAQKELSASLQDKLHISSRVADGIAAAIRPTEVASQDRRAARRR
jgi:hypothetical protein